jgi:regulator of replication initiation timing
MQLSINELVDKTVSLEDMGYHIQGELTELFADIIRARESKSTIKEKIEIVDKMCKNTKGALKSIIEKNTNFEIENLKFKKDLGGSITMLPLTNFDDEQDWLAYVVNSRQEGSDFLVDVFQKSQIEDMKSIADTYDKNIDRLNSNTIDGKTISCSFQFDAGFFFLPKETINVNLEYLTPEEISALVMREIGSMLGMVRHIANHIEKVKVTNFVSEQYLHSDKPLKEKVSFLKNNAKFVKDKETNKVVTAGIDKIKEITQQEPTTMVGEFNKFIYAPIMTLLYTLLSPLTAVAAIVLDMGESAMTGLYNSIVRNGKVSPKTSDKLWAKKDLSNLQQWGIEYVTKRAMGSNLASAELKYRAMMESACFKDLVRADKLDFSYKLSKMYTWVSAVNVGLGGAIMQDESTKTMAKLKKILRSNIALFKQGKHIPSEVLDVYIEDYEKTEHMLNTIHSSIKLQDKATKIMHILKKFVFVPIGMFTHNINTHMKELNEQVDKLNNNKLYASSSKLDRLGRGLK